VTEYFLVGKIVSAEDDKGFLKIDSFSESLERYSKLKKVYLDSLFMSTKHFHIQ